MWPSLIWKRLPVSRQQIFSMRACGSRSRTSRRKLTPQGHRSRDILDASLHQLVCSEDMAAVRAAATKLATLS